MTECVPLVSETISDKPNATGTFTLSGANPAVPGARTVTSQYADGKKLTGRVQNEDASMFEEAVYQFTATGTTLSRVEVTHSSNGNAAVDFSASTTALTFTTDFLAKYAEFLLNPGDVYVTTNGTTSKSLSAGAVNLIDTPLATVVTDPLSWWDTTNKRFKPDRAGLFDIKAWAQLKNVPAGVYQAFFYKNGVSAKAGQTSRADASDWPAVCIEHNVRLNGTTDYADLRVYCDGAANTNEASATCGFTAYWIAP